MQKQLNIPITEELYKQLKQKALMTNVSLKSLVIKALIDSLEGDKNE